MELKDIAESLAKIGLPLLGTALLGPAGALIGKTVADAIGSNDTDPAKIAYSILSGNAEVQDKAREFQMKNREMLLDYRARMYESETKRLEAVNATMQSESKSEHWAQWLWRPFNGFVLGTLVLGDYFVLPLLKIPSPYVPPEVWMALGAILGVASWHRGKAKVTKAEKA